MFWEETTRIPTTLWKYAKCLLSIFNDVSYPINTKNEKKLVYVIGEKYAFNSFMDVNNKNKATNEFQVFDHIVVVGNETNEEEITKFIGEKAFYKP